MFTQLSQTPLQLQAAAEKNVMQAEGLETSWPFKPCRF
jgi:hypothetical protein